MPSPWRQPSNRQALASRNEPDRQEEGGTAGRTACGALVRSLALPAGIGPHPPTGCARTRPSARSPRNSGAAPPRSAVRYAATAPSGAGPTGPTVPTRPSAGQTSAGPARNPARSARTLSCETSSSITWPCAGARNRSARLCGPISPTGRRCTWSTRRSTRPYTSRAAENYGASSPRPCGPGAPCASPDARHSNASRATHTPWS
jgi:hypothetical protein